MSDPKVLADALVDAGMIGSWANGMYLRPGAKWDYQTATEIITDWRVAGRVLESIDNFGMSRLAEGDWQVSVSQGELYENAPAIVQNDDPCRAIIEAWYEARQ